MIFTGLRVLFDASLLFFIMSSSWQNDKNRGWANVLASGCVIPHRGWRVWYIRWFIQTACTNGTYLILQISDLTFTFFSAVSLSVYPLDHFKSSSLSNVFNIMEEYSLLLIVMLVMFRKALNRLHPVATFWVFFHCTNRRPIARSVLLLSSNRSRNIFSVPWLQRLPHPCNGRCRGFPYTILQYGHIARNSWMTVTLNSRPLSLCKLWGVSMSKNTFSNFSSTFCFQRAMNKQILLHNFSSSLTVCGPHKE